MTTNAENDKVIDKKKQKKKRTFWGVIKYFIYTLIILALIMVSTGLFIFYTTMSSIGDVDVQVIKNAMSEASVVYDASGNKIGEFKSSNSRIVANYEDIPDSFKKALLAIEDVDFYKHNGFSVKRLFGAVIANIKAGYTAQGGSTLTQQLAKGIFLTNEKTLDRKVKELCYSILLEKKLSKNEILHAYANTMYLGKGSYGVASAAKNYFDKSLDELTLAESALLAGITKHPTKYDAYKALDISIEDDFSEIEPVLLDLPKTVTEEDLSIYKKLLEHKRITESQYKSLEKGKRSVYKAVFNEKSKNRQRIVLRRMLEEEFITKEEYDKALAEKIKIKIPQEEEQQLSSYFVDYVKQEVVDSLMADNYTKEEALNLIYNRGLKIYTTLDMNMQKKTEKEFADGSNFPYTKYDKNGIAQPQGAMVIIDHKTGEIKSMVGGRGINGNSLYNRAIKPRQPGSTIKPIAVYLPALARTNIYPSTIVKDEPLYLNGSDKPYPNNYQKKYRGTITLTEAVKHSSNVIAAKTLLSLADKPADAYKISIEFLEKLGISTLVKKEDSPSHNDENLPLALGGLTKGISPLEMAASYATIANDGVYIKPKSVIKVLDSSDNVLYEAKAEKTQVFSKQVAQRMTQMLEEVVKSGTAMRASLPNGIASAGKTGTTSDSKDVWFVGYSPYYVAATWIGCDIPTELGVGSSSAVRLWDVVMKSIHSNLPSKQFYDKSKYVEVSICSETLKLATKKCKLLGHEIEVTYEKGDQPTQECTKHEYTEYDAWLDKKKKEESETSKKDESSSESSSSTSSSSNSSNSSSGSSSNSGSGSSSGSSSSSGSGSSSGSSSNSGSESSSGSSSSSSNGTSGDDE